MVSATSAPEPDATPSELVQFAELVVATDRAVHGFQALMGARYARTLLALLRPEGTERRIVARRVKARDLRVGDCFSFIEPDYWNDLDKAVRLSIGERVYVQVKHGFVRGYGEPESADPADDLETEVTLVESVPVRWLEELDRLRVENRQLVDERDRLQRQLTIAELDLPGRPASNSEVL